MRPGVYILLFVLLAWLAGLGWCHSHSCPECQTASAAVPAAVSDDAALSIIIEDGDVDFTTSASDNLLFTDGSCEYTTPLSDELQTVFKNTVQHLVDNSNRILVLSGLYEAEESNNCTGADDLGIGRAEQVEQLLVSMGASDAQIEIAASTIQDLADYKELKVGGVSYNFRTLEEEAFSTPEFTEESLRAENITLYFNTMEQELNLNDDQLIYLENLKAFIIQNPDAQLLVEGHTDSSGEDKTNERLRRKRAQFVMEYLIDQGIPKEQIEHIGRGPDFPIASNSTEEGKAKNRRVEITLK